MGASMASFEDRLKDVRGRIADAARRSGREPSTVTLVAVTKTHPAETLRPAYENGLRDFGENRVQEALPKQAALPPDIRWHLIGQLQTNKINKIPGRFVLVHSVDSVSLAKAMSDRFAAEPQDILLEVNTSSEASKSGVSPAGAVQAVGELLSLPHLRLRGLMTVGPLTDVEAKQREAFRTLKGLFDDVRARGQAGSRFDILSMGMSSDFEAAIEEGATLVRVGTALFGQRPNLLNAPRQPSAGGVNETPSSQS
jgi:pyridoxal phosphate enzyme (YggS family)